MIALWTKGIIATRWKHLAMSATGIVAATALIGTIGVFGISSGGTMTARALSALPVDWQIALGAGADTTAITAKLRAAAPVRASRVIGYADATTFSARLGGTTQTTGAGQIVGLPLDYAATFPGQIRVLLGSAKGVLLAQQTAANLHATVGDAVTLTPAGAEPFDITVEGIVDLPNADPMFQAIGPQKGPVATAPPDNIAMLPMEVWAAHFAAAAKAPGGGARVQIHATLDHADLSAAPDAAFASVTGKTRNFELRAAGEAMVGDNLAARLNGVRQDAIFARILLLFLGLPGAVLALFLTIAIARSNVARQRREQALLGLRGASNAQIAALAFVDAGLVAASGSACGVALAAAVSSLVLGVDLSPASLRLWLLAAGIFGFVIAVAAVVTPALLDLRSQNVAARRAWLTPGAVPLWRRVHADLGLLLIAAAIYWHSASTGYQVVLAPEGVAAAAVDYTAFLAPLLFWTGSGLLILRLAGAALRVGGPALQWALSPLAGRLKAPVAAALSRQHRRLASGAALVALAFAFALATALFTTTYNAQLLVDARLTNGADVTVTGTAAIPAGDALDSIRAAPGVAAAEPMQHRFAYVGKDLQDMYGIDAGQIGKATDIVDAYFGDGDARGSLARLATTPDGVLVSQETVDDFQLAPGDLVNLRLQAAGETRTVPFHLAGVVKEFPTAPHDSFLVANSAYLAAQTGNARAEMVLVRAIGDPASLAKIIRERLGPATPLRVTDISQAAHLIGSSLTAVDLGVLGDVELAFAVLFVAMATGLTLWLGQSGRARGNAILLSLGASQKNIRAFVWGEALVVLGFGLPCGAAIGAIGAWMLVRLLNGVFDPPPATLTWPLGYLGLVFASAVVATAIAVLAQGTLSKEWAVRELRAGG